jgi:hypothetical protein
MVTSASQPVHLPSPRKSGLWPVLLVLALLSVTAVWLTYLAMRRPYIGKTDPETGYRCTFTLAAYWNPTGIVRPGWSLKRDDFVFALPKPPPFQTWLEKNVLHRTPLPDSFPELKNEIHVTSGDQIRSGIRSPFRNFVLQDDYPTPKHPDFVDPPGTIVMEENHLLVAGQPALLRVTCADIPPRSRISGVMRSGPSRFYTDTLVVKVKGKDLWFAIVGTAYDDHQEQIQNDVRAVGDSLHIEQVRGE